MQECYDRQWRDACDDARTLDSKANTEWVTAQRWEQVAEKAAREEVSLLRLPAIFASAARACLLFRFMYIPHELHMDRARACGENGDRVVKRWASTMEHPSTSKVYI